MAHDETLTLTLPEPLAHEARRAVERGDYSEPSDVVAAALNAWIERGSPPAMTTARLRELIKEADPDVVDAVCRVHEEWRQISITIGDGATDSMHP